MFETIISGLFGEWFYTALRFMLLFYPVWLPIVLGIIFIQVWLRYIRADFISKQGSMLLEFRLPREIMRSPVAMEVVLNGLYQAGTGSIADVYYKGKVRPWFSLELVSIEGAVKFFIWTQPRFKNVIESQVYSQFPDVEIYEAPDYTKWFQYDPKQFKLFGVQFELTKPDAYPIKTYIDYGLEKDPKEENEVNPLGGVLEYLGSLKQNEHAWIQILIQPHKSEGIKTGRATKREDWKKRADDEIKKIVTDAKFKTADQPGNFLVISPGQAEMVKAIERNMSKMPFDSMIRAVYIAKTENFDAGNIAGLIGTMRQFSSNILNGFKPGFNTDILDYPWQDFKGMRKREFERKIIDAYKWRSIFHPPYKNYKGQPYLLTAEEIATLYHFPGAAVATPTLTRIPSKKGQAPSNLPV
jgi:hypothetical protein